MSVPTHHIPTHLCPPTFKPTNQINQTTPPNQKDRSDYIASVNQSWLKYHSVSPPSACQSTGDEYVAQSPIRPIVIDDDPIADEPIISGETIVIDSDDDDATHHHDMEEEPRTPPHQGIRPPLCAGAPRRPSRKSTRLSGEDPWLVARIRKDVKLELEKSHQEVVEQLKKQIQQHLDDTLQYCAIIGDLREENQLLRQDYNTLRWKVYTGTARPEDMGYRTRPVGRTDEQ